MANQFEPRTSTNPDDEAEMLAAIDEGIADADAGRVTPAEEAKRLLTIWHSARQEPNLKD